MPDFFVSLFYHCSITKKYTKIGEYTLDTVANRMGIDGALSEKTLQESCPKDIKAYVKEMNKLYKHKK